MTKTDICRISGGVLVVLVGVAVGFGGYLLSGGVPSSWPDVIADDATARNVARAMLAVAAILLVGGGAATANAAWGYWVAVSATLLFVIGAFWANYLLFGSMRPMHTGTNVIVAAVICWLLWVGYSASRTHA